MAWTKQETSGAAFCNGPDFSIPDDVWIWQLHSYDCHAKAGKVVKALFLANQNDRILLVISSLTAEGTPILALGMARIWLRKGVNFKVCTFRDSPADLAREFSEIGIEVDNLSLTYTGYRQFTEIICNVRDYCLHNRFDSVLSFPFGWHSYVAWGAGLVGVRRLVAHAGNYPPVESSTAIRKLRATLAIGSVWRPKIACCSNHVRTGIAEFLRVPQSHLHTVYNGIDLREFHDTPQRNLNQDPFRVGMVARFETHKDQPTLLRAVQLLKSRGIEIRVDLVGDGIRRAEFGALAKQLGVSEQVHFAGVRRDIPELLREWNAFVFSVTPDEGLGIALIEALAAGVPVIASDVGACREVLTCPTYGMLGALFKVGDAAHLADTILQFKANPEPWWDRAKLATASVQSRFSIESMADEYLKLLTEK